MHELISGEEKDLISFHQEAVIADSPSEAIDKRIQYEEESIRARVARLNKLKENRYSLRQYRINERGEFSSTIVL